MNMLTISLLQSTADVHIGFFEWTAIGMPMVLVLTPLAWWLVIRAFPPEIGRLAGMDLVEREYAGLGGLGRRESVFIAVLAVNFILWSTEKLHGIPLPWRRSSAARSSRSRPSNCSHGNRTRAGSDGTASC